MEKRLDAYIVRPTITYSSGDDGFPILLKIPGFVFAIASTGLKLAKNEKWLTRTLLISRNWYYDIKVTEKASKFSPVNTETTFIRRMGI